MNATRERRPTLLLAALLFAVPDASWARTVTLRLPIQHASVPKQYTVPPASSCDGKTTNASNGAMLYESSPADEHSGSPALIGTTRFNGASSTTTVWGYGWSSDFDHQLLVSPDRSVIWLRADGSQLLFLNTSASTVTAPSFLAPVGTFETMAPGQIANGILLSATERDPDGTTRTFSAFESTSVLRLSQLVDSNGNTVTYSRDSQGRLTKVTDVHGRYFNISYNGSGLVSSLADSGGRTTSFTYDSDGNRSSESGPYGTTSYEYDAAHHLTKITYPNAGVRNYTYDSQGRVLTEDDGNGNNALSYVYTPTSTTITDALGRHTVYEFTERQGLRKPIKITDPAGGVTTLTYDSNYNIATETDPNGHTTHYTYDARGNVTATQDAAGGTTTTAYEAVFNKPTQITDPNSHSTSFGYDNQGNNTTITDPLSHTTQNEFDGFGHVSQTHDPLSHTTHFTYDPATGALASTTDPLNRTTNLTNDALSRVIQNIDPTGNATHYQYDTASDMTQVTDALGGVTQYTYSPGRTGKLLAQVKDALGHTTTFGYDDLGRLTSVTNALGQQKTSTYDAKGNLIQTKNARGQVTTYTYDQNDRLTKKHMVEGDITYAYDAAGNMLAAQHYNGSSIANTYDADNRLTQQIQILPSGYSATLGYTYDAAGNRRSMSTPWGTFTYTYDANNRLTGITNPQNLTFTFEYDAAGRRTKLTYPNGIVTTYAYDAAGQVLSITAKRTADQVIVSSIAYTYDAAGNRTTMTDWSGTHTYGYDTLNRLTSATHPAASHLPVLNETFTYDAVGNRLADAALTGYTYDVANRLQHNSGYSYSFNADGDLAVRTDTSANQTSFGYDSANEQTSATTPNGENWSYSYDASGRRVGKSSSTASTQQFVYDASGVLLATLDTNNNPTFTYTSEPRLGAPLFMKRADGSGFYYHADGLASPVAHTDQSGDLLDTIAYTAFGMTAFNQAGLTVSGSVPGDRIALSGQIYDSETANYVFGRREYDPASGRFTAEDPIGINGGLNRYAYVDGNPLRFVDPAGLWSVSYDAYFGFGGGFTFGRDDTGRTFVKFRGGFGEGGGVFVDFRDQGPQRAAPTASARFCAVANLSGGYGPFSAYGSKESPGLRVQLLDAPHFSVTHTPLEQGWGLSDTWGVGAGASLTGQITLY